MTKRSVEEISEFARAQIAKTLALPVERVDPDTKFARLGLDSATALHVMVAIEDWLDAELDPELAFEHPTVRSLAAAIHARL